MSDGKIAKRDKQNEIEKSRSSGSETIVKIGDIEGGVRFESSNEGQEVKAYLRDNKGNGVACRAWW